MLTKDRAKRLRLMADRISEMRATLLDPDMREGADEDEGEAIDEAENFLREAWVVLTLFT